MIPGNGTAEIFIEYNPTGMTTATCDIEVNISQFNFTPIKCSIYGNSSPPIVVYDKLSRKEPTEEWKEIKQPTEKKTQ